MFLKLSKYKRLSKLYGSNVHVTFGRKIFPSGEQFIKDAKTGKVYEYTNSIKYLGRDAGGRNYYLHEKHTLKKSDTPIASF